MTTQMGPILERIVASKKEEVRALRAKCPIQSLQREAAAAPAPRDFRAAVTQQGRVGLIAEVKKASPSKGLIREDFDPVEIAKAYGRGGADAISCLTDAPFFQGSLDIFRAVRAATDLPMLRKDFMIDAAQFYEARAAGADCVLLITSILTDTQLRDFHALALDLGMAALVETHSAADIERVMQNISPCLLGVNNRDLHDPQFQTDLQHTGEMAPLIDRLAEGARPPLVSESGIYTAGDISRLREFGVAAVLVGESLMRQENVENAVKILMG